MEKTDTKQKASDQGDPVSEEVLMKKGKYLLQHLKNLDPLTGEFTTIEPSTSGKS
jgi:hypothetical protein